MEYCCAILLLILIPVIALGGIIAKFDSQLKAKSKSIISEINRRELDMSHRVTKCFLIQPCFRCHEFEMLLLEISPNARSLEYQCKHCKKKVRASASTQDSERVIKPWATLCSLVEEYNARRQNSKPIHQQEIITVNVAFRAPPAPLPYEQTSRTPIPEAAKSEVWRRDGGKCVQCGSQQNLQFDHIIPVVLGGATTVANLQLLCQPCNGSKGKRI